MRLKPSGGDVSTVQLASATRGSRALLKSLSRTRNVCRPSASPEMCAVDRQDAKSPSMNGNWPVFENGLPSRLHWKFMPKSSDLNGMSARVEEVTAGGGVLITTGRACSLTTKP